MRIHLRLPLAACSFALALAAGAILLAQSGRGPAPPAPVPAEAIPGPTTPWTLAAAGDAIITRRVMPFDTDTDPRFRRLVEIIRGADTSFLNLEINLFRMGEFKGWPEVENGGNWELGPPEAALDLKAMGFDVVNRANNHATDYGVEGLRVTTRLLDEIGLAHAGSGNNLGQASRPAYVESKAGRVAVIGLATTFTNMSRAGEARDDVMGRPGINALRVQRRFEADEATFAALAEASEKFGATRPNPNAPVRLLGAAVQKGAKTQVVEALNASDEARVLREVTNATNLADHVVVTSHSHEPGNDSLIPPPWLAVFARKCIDTGATAFVIHGPHQIRGIEIYKGRPIFYSLGNFIFQNETIDPMPSDHYEMFNLPNTALASDLYNARFEGGSTGFPSSPVWYESLVALPTFKGGQLIDLKLYPIDMQQKAPRSQRGTPRLADEATGRRILQRITELSAAFGTALRIENGVGVWRPSAPTTSGSPIGRR